MTLAGGMTMSTTYGTPEARLELAAMSGDMPPMLRGMYGDPVNVDTLGGFISWHYGAYFALLAGLWSILALSSTLAGEARRGSLEFAVATPRSKRSIALEKVAGTSWRSSLAMAIVAVVAWATGAVACHAARRRDLAARGGLVRRRARGQGARSPGRSRSRWRRSSDAAPRPGSQAR